MSKRKSVEKWDSSREKQSKHDQQDPSHPGQELGNFFKNFFSYEHEQLKDESKKKIRKRLGILYRIWQFGIIIYTLVYVIGIQRGYQDISGITSFVMTDVNGIIHPNLTDDQLKLLSLGYQDGKKVNSYENVMDAMDYVLPVQQIGDFFVITHGVATNQAQSVCPEGASVASAHCISRKDNSTCQEGRKSINGVMTGNCVKNPVVKTTFVCEIQGWCPVPENKKVSSGNRVIVITGIENSTVQIINNIAFTLFSEKTQNIQRDVDKLDYLKTCLYNEITDRFCPVFKLGDIVQEVGVNYSVLSEMGGVIMITISWNCNLDWNVHECAPTYHFSSLSENGEKGYHVMHANEYENESRTLYNATGIYFLIQVEGFGKKFNFQQLVINILVIKTSFDLLDVTCNLAIDKYYSWKIKEKLVVCWTKLHKCLTTCCCCYSGDEASRLV